MSSSAVLEHNSVVWSPHLIQDVMRIEKVQRHFTTKLRGFRNLLSGSQTHSVVCIFINCITCRF